MGNKRISQIAKELGIESKAIVEKCLAEGIPNIKGHNTPIGPGLEATIKEWFSSTTAVTAVEIAPHVDLEKVKVKKTRATKRSADGSPAEGETGGVGTETATLPDNGTTVDAPSRISSGSGSVHGGQSGTAAPAEGLPARRATPAAATESVPAAKPATKASEPAGAKPAAGATSPAPSQAAAPAAGEVAARNGAAAPEATASPAAPARPAGHSMPRSVISMTPPSSIRPTSVAPPAITEEVKPSRGTTAPAARGSEKGHEKDHGGEHGPSGHGGTRAAGGTPPPAPPRTITPAPMNVPTRPTVVSPAGPQLQNLAPVKLAGPKVVRVEAPDQVEAPRSRRTVGGPGAGGPGREDDRGMRSPRRGAGPGVGAGAGAGAGGANAKRSTGTGIPDRRRGRSGEDWVGSTQGIFSEQDLIEREARLARAGGFVKKHKQDLRKGVPGQRADTPAQSGGKVRIAAPFTIKDLSATTGIKAADIVKKLFLQGVMATINSGIESEKAVEIMMDFDIELEVTTLRTAEEALSDARETRQTIDERPRGPVVTILGHVDHGKTSLLDKIRNANVAAGEAGGITQRTSAFRVPLEVGGETKEIVFLDTPGHEAFTGMRARGAQLTDVVVLVVSAPEGVMPQTIESINHAKAAKVPIVVALNKIDRPDATEPQIQKTLGQLADAGLNPVMWGGETEVVRTSATTGTGIKELLEILDLQSQVLELKADFGGPALGTVIEAKTEEGRGAVANLLIQRGELEVGDFIVVGRAFGRVREITDDRGARIRKAVPPMPVQISGIDEVPDAGDKFYVVDTLKKAQEAAEQRRHRERQVQLAQPKLTLDNMFAQITDADVKEIKVIVKAAEQGTVDVLRTECEKVRGAEVKVRVLHGAIGGITESDVLLADASRAIVIGFNVIPSGKARQLAESKGIEIRTYEVIYDIVDDLKKAAEGMLAPELRQEILGHAEVRAVFKVTKVGNIAGCYITDGNVQRDALIRVTRNGVVIENGRKLAQLKRLKDDAKEVRAGMECGMKIDGYDDIKEGDILECYKQVEVKRSL